MPSDYVKDLVDHKQRVASYMQIVANDLFKRAAVHDNSKFSPEEYGPYDEAFPHLQKYAYGTEELRAELRKIKPAIAHHFQANDHHPEHFETGILGMDLIQLVEMVCDWLAASERSQTDMSKGLQINKERFHLDEQLSAAIYHTVKRIAPAKLQETDPNNLS